MNAEENKTDISTLMTFFALPSVLTILVVMAALGGESLTQWLRYDRDSILAGEVWRIFTAHITHLGWKHLLMNIAGLILIWALFGRLLTIRVWVAVILASAAVISLGLLIFNPQIRWYVGLSGVLHGMFLLGAILSVYQGYRAEILLLVFIIGKLAWEQRYGPLPGSASLAGGSVLVDAHLYGAIAGVIIAMIIIVKKGLRTKG
jgi:rhomboid family GlyGly-CTERM serine protease